MFGGREELIAEHQQQQKSPSKYLVRMLHKPCEWSLVVWLASIVRHILNSNASYCFLSKLHYVHLESLAPVSLKFQVNDILGNKFEKKELQMDVLRVFKRNRDVKCIQTWTQPKAKIEEERDTEREIYTLCRYWFSDMIYAIIAISFGISKQLYLSILIDTHTAFT